MRIAVAGSSGLIGTQVCRLATEAGHDVVPLSRTHGVDLLDADALTGKLAGVEAVVDVSRPQTTSLDAACDFFTTVAGHLATEGQRAGVRRSVVLSIVGVDRSQDYDWYVATLAHERATIEQAPGARVLRSTQFHEFPGQMLQRALSATDRSGSVEIMDVPIQPVDSAEVAQSLLDLATDPDGRDRQVAGPRTERLVDLVAELVAHQDLGVTVLPGPAPDSMAAGSLLPDRHTTGQGIDWRTWLQHRGGTG